MSSVNQGVEYDIIISSVNRTIRDALDGIVVREQQAVAKQPQYPFATYSLNNIFNDVKNYNRGEAELKQSVEIIVSYTFYDKSSFVSASLAQRAMTNLQHYATHQSLVSKGIAVVDISSVGNRDTFLTVDVERRVGFDVRLRVATTYTKEIEEMKSVVIDDEIIEGED